MALQRETVLRIRRELRGILLALLMVAATTIVAYALTHYLDVRRGSVLYLIPVMLAGWHLGLIPAVVAAIAGVLWSGYFFYSPFYSYFLARPTEILNLALFMVVGMVTSHLASRAKHHAELARKRENEMSDLYAFSRRLAAAPSAAEIYLAIEEYLANLVQRNVMLFEAGSANNPPDLSAVPEEMRAAIGEIQRGGTLATTIEDKSGNTWFIRRVSQRTPDFGVIAIDLGSVPKTCRRRHPRAGRRGVVRRRGHAGAARRRAHPERSQDALGDRAPARGADRFGIARAAHAAGVDSRRGDGADAIGRRSPRTSA